MIKFSSEQISNFPVAHLSFSAIRCYMTDRQLFFKRHIRFEYGDMGSPSLIEGKAYHKALEVFWGKAKTQGTPNIDEHDWNEVIAHAMNYLITEAETGKVNFGKTGSVSKSAKTVEQALSFYRQELPHYHPLYIEAMVKTEISDLDGEIMPIPIKIVYDLVSNPDLDIIEIIDHKLVTTYSEDNPAYELQAAASFFTYWFKFGKKPWRMIFDEMKKSKNADKSPQRRPYIINFQSENGDYHPCLYRFLEVYRRVVMELAGFPLIGEDGQMKFIPNPFDMMNGEESWEDFCKEVKNGSPITKDQLNDLKAKAEEIEALLSENV